MEAAMCASFVVLLHIPRVLAAPASQLEWTMLCISLAITGAAWVIRSHATSRVVSFASSPLRAEA
jgi:hypothetical protein